MERPYGISDFAFSNHWDRESTRDLMERAGRNSERDQEHDQAERERKSARGSIPCEQKSQTVDSASLVPGFKGGNQIPAQENGR
jgi:hypothetical protein